MYVCTHTAGYKTGSRWWLGRAVEVAETWGGMVVSMTAAAAEEVRDGTINEALRRSSALSTNDTTGCGCCCGDVWAGCRVSTAIRAGPLTRVLQVDNQVLGLSG